ncbi:MAG: family metallopeptidase [Solirubrobacterales bacterium]|jgi:predicted metal-dependent hydrolase|nr:family metallopeptidase [Solirubrobacterales bacterium]
MAAQSIEYTVRRSDRARRVRVTVHPQGEVEVVLPRRARDREAAAAVAELRPWIERRLAEAVVVRERIAERGDTVPFLGEPLRLVREAGRTRAHRRGDALLVPAGEPGPAIERWYRRMARAEFEWRLDEAVADLGLTYASVRIGNQQTRWGSCSSTGAMSFNWRLLLAPEDVLDYVVWHEACHLRHLDHSPRFWGLLERHRPGYREQKAWLRRHGATLVL